MKHILRIVTFALAVVILGACSSKKSAVGTPAGPAEIPGNSTRTEAWHTLKCPVRLSLRQPMALSASGRALMVRDSLIHISARLLGMEVAVIRADRDSAWLVDRYHKVYTSMPIAALISDYGVTLADAQELLLGRADLASLFPAAAERVSFSADEFRDTPVGQVASEVSFSALIHKRQVSGYLRWDLNKAEWDIPVDAGWSVPSGYRYLEPKRLLQTLKSF